MYLFCVANHTPLQLRDFLEKHSIVKPKGVNIQPIGVPLSESPKKKVLILLNIQDFLRNIEVLNSDAYEECSVFLFCAPFRAIEFENSVLLDSDTTKERFRFTLTKLRSSLIKKAYKRGPIVSERRKDKYLYALVEDMREGSLLTPLMTFIYKLSKATHQTPVKEAVVLYLFNGISLEKALEQRKIDLSPKQFDALTSILTTKGGPYREALKFFKQKRKEDPKYPVSSLVKPFNVQAYEISYLRKIKNSLTTYGKNVGNTTIYLSGKGKGKKKKTKNKGSKYGT